MVNIAKFDDPKTVSTLGQLLNGSSRASEKNGRDFMELLMGKMGQSEANDQAKMPQFQSEPLNPMPRQLNMYSMENYRNELAFKIDDSVRTAPVEKYPVEKEKGTVADAKEETASVKEPEDEPKAATEKVVEKKEEETAKKQNDAAMMAAFLEKTFSSQVSFKVTPQVKKSSSEAGGKIEIDLKLKNPGNLNMEKFMTRIENMMKKEFPSVNLADFKIELESFQKSKNLSARDNLRVDGKKGKHGEISLLNNQSAASKQAVEGEGALKIASGENAAKTLLNKGDQKKMNENGQAGVSMNAKNQQADAAGKVFEVKAPVKIDQASIIEQIKNNMGNMKPGAAENTYAIKMSLNPEALGRISLEVVLSDGGVTAKFSSENAQTHEILLAASDQLKEMLGEKGIKVAKIEFSKDASLFAGGEGLNGGRQSFDQNASGNGGGRGFDGHSRNTGAMNDQAARKDGGAVTGAQAADANDTAVNMRI